MLIIIMKTLGILIILNLFSFCCFAQSKHTSVWNRDNYVIKFDANSVHIEDNPDFFNKEILYVDSKGKTQLILDYQGLLLNDNFEPIEGCEKVDMDNPFVVPVPHNCNFVYFFGGKQYCLVDIEKSEIVGDVVSLKELEDVDEFILFNHILVHHSNCEDVWLMYYDTDIMYKYLITAFGIEYNGAIQINRQISNSHNKDYIIHLSNDCNHYTANYLGDSIVCYGDFDRETGNFVRKSEVMIHSRPEVMKTRVLNSLIANDNKTIYYYCESTMDGWIHSNEILSVDIVAGKPDYETVNILYSKIFHRSLYDVSDMFYGNDGNIYILDDNLGNMFRLIPSSDGKIIVDDAFLNFESEGGTRYENFLADWFSQNPCGENCDCPEIKKPVIKCE